MRWKDLSIRDKAELIRLGVLAGITDRKAIIKMYEELSDTVSEQPLSTGQQIAELNMGERPRPPYNILRPSNTVNARPVPGFMDSVRVREESQRRRYRPEDRILNQMAEGGYTDSPPDSTNTRYDPIVQRLLERYKDESFPDFLERLLFNDTVSVRDWENPDNRASLKLSSAEQDGKGIVYPEVLRINDTLHDFTDPKWKHDKWDALRSAEQRGDTIMFNTPIGALKFSENYKLYFPEYFNSYEKGGPIKRKKRE